MGYSQTTLSTALLPHSLSHGERHCACVRMRRPWFWPNMERGRLRLLLSSTHAKGGGDHNDFNCGSTPPNRRPAPPRQRQLRWAMKRRRCGSDILQGGADFLKRKKKSRVPLLPLVVDSPKHWVWRGFWSLEFDARLIHRLLRVCTRWPRVNEHKLIPFAHQGNVQLNLICTLQLKIFEYF